MATVKVEIDQPGWKWSGEVDYSLSYPKPPRQVIQKGLRVQDINSRTPFVISVFEKTNKGLTVTDETGEFWARVDEICLA